MRVGIIGAMCEELAFLKSSLSLTESISMFGLIFETGELNNIELVLVQTGIGKVNAAVGSSLLIHHFSPDYIVNVGVAGSFKDEINIGDVVLASEVRHHDVNVTLFGYEPGQVPKMPPSFRADPRLVEMAQQVANNTAHVGLIVSGDHYFDNLFTVNDITCRFPNVFAAEMEAASIGHVCWMANVPFIIIRSISDKPGRDGQESFNQNISNVSESSASLLLKLVETESFCFEGRSAL